MSMGSSLETKLKVGITSFLAIIILFGGVLWVKKYNPILKKKNMTVLFNDAKGISVGDPVHLSGIKIGEISSVTLDENNSAKIEFGISKNIRLYADCAFTIKDVGLMGDKALVIYPGIENAPLDLTKVHYGTDSTDLNDLIVRANDVMEKLHKISEKIDNDLDIIKLTQSFEYTFNKFQQAIATYEDIALENREPLRKSFNSFQESAHDLREFIQNNDDRFETALNSFQQTSQKLSLALDNIEKFSTVVDSLSLYMRSGKGTFAKLVRSDDLYEELRRTNANIDSFITDFKLNPGKYTKDMKFKVRLF